MRHPGWASKSVAKAEVARAKGLELAMALQRRWVSVECHTGLPVETVKLPSEVNDGSPCHRDADSHETWWQG